MFSSFVQGRPAPLFFAAFVAMLCSAAAWSHDFTAGELRIGHPYAITTPPGARVAGAYLSIENKGSAADRLLRATSPRAGAVELHRMSMEGNVMRMRAVPAIDVAAGGSVRLAPGGLHLMLTDIRQPLKPGDRFPVVLEFEKTGKVNVEVVVQDAATGAAAAASHQH